VNLNLDLIKVGVNLNDVDTLDVTLQLMMKQMRTFGQKHDALLFRSSKKPH
jgi:hypothetical protein